MVGELPLWGVGWPRRGATRLFTPAALVLGLEPAPTPAPARTAAPGDRPLFFRTRPLSDLAVLTASLAAFRSAAAGASTPADKVQLRSAPRPPLVPLSPVVPEGGAPPPNSHATCPRWPFAPAPRGGCFVEGLAPCVSPNNAGMPFAAPPAGRRRDRTAERGRVRVVLLPPLLATVRVSATCCCAVVCGARLFVRAPNRERPTSVAPVALRDMVLAV